MVTHSITTFFVFKPSGVLEDDANDTLVNVNIMDDERIETNLKNLREVKAGGYNPYEEEIDPLTGDITRKGKTFQSLLLQVYYFANNSQKNFQYL